MAIWVKTILNNFSTDKFDCGKVIKKIYKTITPNLNLFYSEPKTELFGDIRRKTELSF